MEPLVSPATGKDPMGRRRTLGPASGTDPLTGLSTNKDLFVYPCKRLPDPDPLVLLLDTYVVGVTRRTPEPRDRAQVQTLRRRRRGPLLDTVVGRRGPALTPGSTGTSHRRCGYGCRGVDRTLSSTKRGTCSVGDKSSPTNPDPRQGTVSITD